MRFDYSNKHNSKKNDENKKNEETTIYEKNKDNILDEPEVEEKTIEELEVEEALDKLEEEFAEETESIEDENIKEEKQKEVKIGELKDCDLLNVRQEPKIDSPVLLVLDKNSKIEILEELEDFYKILVNNKEGYCVKKFIIIK